MRSSTFGTMIIRKSNDNNEGSPNFKIGLTFDSFHWDGTLLDSSEKLNNEVRSGEIESAVFLTIILEMPPGPEAVDKSLDTSSTKQVILEREQSRDLKVSEREEEKEEGQEKQDEKT